MPQFILVGISDLGFWFPPSLDGSLHNPAIVVSFLPTPLPIFSLLPPLHPRLRQRICSLARISNVSLVSSHSGTMICIYYIIIKTAQVIAWSTFAHQGGPHCLMTRFCEVEIEFLVHVSNYPPSAC